MVRDQSVPRKTIALVAAFWFLLTSAIWVYFVNVIISFPFGILAYYLWTKMRHNEGIVPRIVIITLGVGTLISIISLIVLLVSN